MVIKMPPLSKAEKICAILSYWDPCQKKDEAGPRFYNYEAEVLAQSLRKNSKVETVGKKVKTVIDRKLKEEGLEYTVSQDNAQRVAAAMIQAIQ